MTLPDTIQIECSCGWTAHVYAELAGKKLRCQQCKGVITAPNLPSAGGSTPAPEIVETSRPTASGDGRSAHSNIDRRERSEARRPPAPIKSKSTNSRAAKPGRRRSQPTAAAPPPRLKRGSRPVRSPPYEDDYAPAFDEPEFLTPSRSATSRSAAPRKGRGRKRSSRRGGVPRWVTGLCVTAIAIVGFAFAAYAVVHSDAFARIAGEQFRSETPVYATGRTSLVDYETHFRISEQSSVSKVIDATYHSQCRLTSDKLIFTVSEVKISDITGISNIPLEAVKVTADAAVVTKRLGEVATFSRDQAPQEINKMMRLIGTPLVSQAVGPTGFGALTPITQASNTSLDPLEFAIPCTIFQAPFATNVEWWDAERTWLTSGAGRLDGMVRYEKESVQGDEVTVSLKGQLNAAKTIDMGDLSMFGGTITISGRQTYSTKAHQWLRGRVSLHLSGKARQGRKTGKIQVDVKLDFKGTILESEAVSSRESAMAAASGQATGGPSHQFPASSKPRLPHGSDVPPFYPSGSGWEIPVPAPNSPMLAVDFRPTRQGAVKEKSKTLCSEADRQKSAANYVAAEAKYKQAIMADPTNAFAEYQLACCYSLWGRTDQAAASFQQAVDNGFDDFVTCASDDELGDIRRRSDFRGNLRTIRNRYLARSGSRVGTPLVVLPSGSRPLSGWPVIFLLHGYGDTNVSYLPMAEAWAELNFVVIALPGSIPQSNGSFIWSMDSTEVTHQQVQKVMKALPSNALVDRNQVHLFGFSQGAMHAFQVAMQHPEEYQGVVAMSPGGSPMDFLSTDLTSVKPSHSPLNVWFVHGRQEPLAEIIKLLEDLCEIKGWKTMTVRHGGGHSFPDNISDLLPRMAAFLQK